MPPISLFLLTCHLNSISPSSLFWSLHNIFQNGLDTNTNWISLTRNSFFVYSLVWWLEHLTQLLTRRQGTESPSPWLLKLNVDLSHSKCQINVLWPRQSLSLDIQFEIFIYQFKYQEYFSKKVGVIILAVSFNTQSFVLLSEFLNLPQFLGTQTLSK